MACYVRICESKGNEEIIEVPTEDDGSLLLSTVTAQFPAAVGLRFASPMGALRGVRMNKDGIMDAPPDGWGDVDYYIITKFIKRKLDDEEDVGPLEKLKKLSDKESPDLIMLNLPYTATREDIKEHFEEYGELELYDIKFDSDKKSRGFGFIRFTTVLSAEKAMRESHTILNRNIQLDIAKGPKDKIKGQDRYGVGTKVFIGRLPKETTHDELQKYFSQFGALQDVHIPKPNRGFGFVTFSSERVAHEIMRESHIINGAPVNVAPAAKREEHGGNNPNNPNQNHNQPFNPTGGGMMGGDPNNQFGMAGMAGYGAAGYGAGYYGMYGGMPGAAMNGWNMPNMQTPPVGMGGYGGYGNMQNNNNGGNPSTNNPNNYTNNPTPADGNKVAANNSGSTGNYGWTKP